MATYPFLDKATVSNIRGDLEAYCRHSGIEANLSSFIRIFADHPEFRSIVYYRLKRRYRHLPSLFLKPQTSFFLYCDKIAPGLMAVHAYSTVINAKEVGKNAMVFQQVTIGISLGGGPVIGDNCTFCAGSIVTGPIHIGNNVTVGAGAVVCRDVPDNAVVAGNPAKIVGCNEGKSSRFFLE